MIKASFMAEFNSLVVDRNRLLNNSSIENPLIKSLDGQIIELQQVLMTSLKNLKHGVTLQLSSLKKEVQQNTNRITAVPQQEKEFRDIKRQQEIKRIVILVPFTKT